MDNTIQKLETSLENYKTIREKIKEVKRCSPTFGLQYIDRFVGGSEGRGGGTLLLGFINGTRVILKVFPEECPVYYIEPQSRKLKKKLSTLKDFGKYEIGTGLCLRKLVLETGVSPCVAYCYTYLNCKSVYKIDVCPCTKNL
jgi:hypothetical protein